jgi:hypothetical protein
VAEESGEVSLRSVNVEGRTRRTGPSKGPEGPR